MKESFIVTNEYLAERGLDLNEYALDGTFVTPIIMLGLDIAVSRCCLLNDKFEGEESIEIELDEKPKKVDTFLKLQYRIIYNLIFNNEDNPVDLLVDTIISHELKWGKINGFQKGLYYKNN